MIYNTGTPTTGTPTLAHHRERPWGVISGEYDLQHLISSVGKRINIYIKPPIKTLFYWDSSPCCSAWETNRADYDVASFCVSSRSSFSVFLRFILLRTRESSSTMLLIIEIARCGSGITRRPPPPDSCAFEFGANRFSVSLTLSTANSIQVDESKRARCISKSWKFGSPVDFRRALCFTHNIPAWKSHLKNKIKKHFSTNKLALQHGIVCYTPNTGRFSHARYSKAHRSSKLSSELSGNWRWWLRSEYHPPKGLDR